MKKIRLRDVADVITKGTTPTSIGYEFVNKGINFIKVESITEDGAFIENKFAYITDECNKKLSRSQLQENDILFSIAGAIGRVAIVDKNILPANTNQALAIIRLHKGVYEYNFLKYILKSPAISKQFEKQKQGVAQINLSLKNIGDFEIPVISIEQQKKIADEFDKVTVLIDKRKKQLEKLDELVKSRFVEMFGDIVLNPFSWEKDYLGVVCDVRDGTHDSPHYHSTGFPLVTSKNVTGGKIDLTDCSLISEADFNKINERSKVDIGDIIMPMIGTVGKPVIVKIEPNFAIKNVALIKFKNNSKVLNVYVQTLLQSDYFDDAILSNVRGGTQKFISLGDIRKLEVLIPPLELQEQFAAFVEQVDKSKFEIKQSLEKLELLKKALMQKYFG